MKHYRDVITKGSAQIYLNSLGRDSLVIYSPTSLAQVNIDNANVHMIDSRIFGRNTALMNALCDGGAEYTNLVSLGGGTATDVAKFIATKMNANFTCIPSMLSTNAYSTDKVALVVGENKITLDAKLADRIILDSELVATAGRQNLYGLADVLSIHTALRDWEMAQEDIQENIDIKIFTMASSLLGKTTNFILNTAPEDIQGSSEQIFEKVGESGYITNLYGTGRPESGSEHIFAKALEKRVEIPHGISVSLGITLMSLLQGNDEDDIFSCIRRIGTLTNLEEYGISNSLLSDVLCDLHPREDRYSIINRIHIDKEDAYNLLKKFQIRTNIKLKD